MRRASPDAQSIAGARADRRAAPRSLQAARIPRRGAPRERKTRGAGRQLRSLGAGAPGLAAPTGRPAEERRQGAAGSPSAQSWWGGVATRRGGLARLPARGLAWATHGACPPSLDPPAPNARAASQGGRAGAVLLGGRPAVCLQVCVGLRSGSPPACPIGVVNRYRVPGRTHARSNCLPCRPHSLLTVRTPAAACPRDGRSVQHPQLPPTRPATSQPAWGARSKRAADPRARRARRTRPPQPPALRPPHGCLPVMNGQGGDPLGLGQVRERPGAAPGTRTPLVWAPAASGLPQGSTGARPGPRGAHGGV